MEQHIPNPLVIEQIKEKSLLFKSLENEISKVIVGHEDVIHFIVIAILCNGHILLEGVPGVAKTTMIKAITKALGLHFKRIQFTPDLMPADLIGTLIYNPKTQEFETKKGPIFANLILADEINRAPAKVQAALLEAMQEQQVTIGQHTFPLDRPFLVFATQNPIEQEGTYSLPEAQVDRFLFKLIVDYPTMLQERAIITQKNTFDTIVPVISQQALLQAQELIEHIYIDSKIIDYIVAIVFATRKPEAFKMASLKTLIQYGVSPRATIALYNASRAFAFLKQRHFVTPDDVKSVAPHVLRHRILLTYEAEAQNISVDDVIKTILNSVTAP